MVFGLQRQGVTHTQLQLVPVLFLELGDARATQAGGGGRRGGGRHRRADPGPHGRLAVKLDGSPQQRLQRGPGHAHRGRSERGRPHPDPGGEPVEHRAHLQLDPGPRAPLRLPLPARHGLQLRGAHVRGRQRLRPLVRQLRGRPGCLEPPNGVAKLHFGAHFQAPGLPNQTPSGFSRLPSFWPVLKSLGGVVVSDFFRRLVAACGSHPRPTA